jgi:hypothetical protein
MPRFDPDRYPDRLALDLHVSALRADAIARLFDGLRARIAARFAYALLPASTPISRDTRIGTPGR